MIYFNRTSTAVATAVLLAIQAPLASADTDVSADQMHIFNQSLASDYQALANAEYAQGDRRDAATYAARATAASTGTPTAPDEVALRQSFLNARYVGELSTAHDRLIDALAKTARSDAPAAAARAQTSYDCWLEQATEDLQPADIDACKQSFMTAMTTVESSAQAVADVVPTPVVEPAAPAVIAEPAAESQRVFFAFDSSVVTPEGMAELEKLKANWNSTSPGHLTVIGHASAIGTEEYNQALSERRAEAVKAALIKLGVAAESIDTEGRGERDQLVPTADGVREPRNRQAFVTITP